MKLTAVKEQQLRQNNTNNKQNKNVQFNGLTDTLIRTWEIIDSSRGIQFTVEDMLGTNIPRTYQGAMAGHEYTGEINWPYLLQEGIREFLTGPTMTLAPIAILAIITRLSGETAATHKENIVNLSYLADLVAKNDINEEKFTNSFVERVVRDTLKNTIGVDSTGAEINVDNSDVDELSDLIKNYIKQTKPENQEKGFKETLANIQSLFDPVARHKKKAKKAEVKDALDATQRKFIDIIKTYKESYKDTDFKVAKYSINEKDIGATNFKNYVEYLKAYIVDYTKANKDDKGLINLATENINNFRDIWSGKRIGTVGALILGTGILMSFIPKLYTLASGSINPAGAAIYNEAAKREEKQ